MHITTTDRGFQVIEHPQYRTGEPSRLVQMSSAIDSSERGMSNPGSSFLWIGDHHHLSRDEVRELIDVLNLWLGENRLGVDTANPPPAHAGE